MSFDLNDAMHVLFFDEFLNRYILKQVSIIIIIILASKIALKNKVKTTLNFENHKNLLQKSKPLLIY